MAHGRPAVVANFNMTTPPELLTRVAYSNSSGVNPFREDYLQWLLDSSPELLPVRDFYPEVSSLCSLGREIPVDLGGKMGYIDNLFVTNHAQLVLVETKLYRNPEGIREVVAQTYQYGEAINAMSFLELEAALRKGQKGGNELAVGETIAARVRARELASSFNSVVEDFEDRLARNIRRGEVLYLIVADGILTSVERMAYWLNEIAGSAPHRFGLVELRTYRTADGVGVVVPRSLVRTKEISRHVVVIDSRVPDGTVSTAIEDRTGTESGAVSIASRMVRTAGPSMTKDRLLEEVRARNEGALDIALGLIAALEAQAFDSRALATELQYGFIFPAGEGEFFPLVSLLTSGTWSNLRAKLIAVIGDVEFSAYKARLSQLAPYYRAEEINDAQKKFGHSQRYELLRNQAEGLVDALVATRTISLNALTQTV